MLKNLFLKIKLRINRIRCYTAHKKTGYAVSGEICEGHFHNGEPYICCSKCPYFAGRSEKK